MSEAADAAPAIDPANWPAAKQEWRDPKALKPHPRNPKNHTEAQIDFIAEKMKSRGVWRSLVVDENDVVLIGHGGRLAAIKNGYASIPVYVARDLNDAEKLELVISDNQSGMLTGWDDEMLRADVALIDGAGLDVKKLGFDEKRLADIFSSPKSPTQFESLSADRSSDHSCPSCGYRWNGPADAAPKPADQQ